MPRIFPPLLLAASILVPVDASSQDSGGARAALAAASERFASIDGLCADFVQELSIELLAQERTSRGRLCQLRPNLFRMDFSDPDGDRVVADGSHFWVYYRSVNPGQVVRMPVDPSRGGLDFYREFLENPAGTYHIESRGTEAVAGTRTERIGLTPKAPRGYREAEVWIDPERRLIRRVRVVEDNGTVRTVTLTGIEVNPDLSPADFTYTPPAGVRVIGG